MKITIVGSGNIATFFGIKFKKAGHSILQVISSTESHAKELADTLSCDFDTDLNKLNVDSEVVLLAVKDDVLRTLVGYEVLQTKTIIHTAGSISLLDIASLSKNVGSMWCMYSINKNHLPERDDIPVIVNASNENTLVQVKKLSEAISNVTYSLDDDQKTIAHLSAVFANNFANHLFTIGQEILSQEKIPFEILIPLIQNTIEKLSYSTPDKLQTGPAIRHDGETISKHLQLLQSNEEFLKIYQLLTHSIQQRY